MDTVTESDMGIGMARHGGLGVLHRNMDVDQMVAEIERVKRADELIIRDVVTAAPDQTVRDVDQMMEQQGVSGAPVVDDDGQVPGIISATDIRPYLEVGEDDAVDEAMTDEVITASEDVTAREALELMYEHKIERVPIVDEQNRLIGLVTMQGILQRREYDTAARDENGRLVAGAAVGPFELDRATAADEAGADVCSSTPHTPTTSTSSTAPARSRETVDADVVVGNIGTREAAEDVVDFADGVKVGIGPGSICTTPRRHRRRDAPDYSRLPGRRRGQPARRPRHRRRRHPVLRRRHQGRRRRCGRRHARLVLRRHRRGTGPRHHDERQRSTSSTAAWAPSAR